MPERAQLAQLALAPAELAQALWACAALAAQPEGARVAPLLGSELAALDRPQEIANSAWALATLALFRPRRAAAVQTAADPLVAAFTVPELSALVWAFAAAAEREPAAWLHELLQRLASRLDEADPQGVSNCVWAAAALRLERAAVRPVTNATATLWETGKCKVEEGWAS